MFRAQASSRSHNGTWAIERLVESYSVWSIVGVRARGREKRRSRAVHWYQLNALVTVLCPDTFPPRLSLHYIDSTFAAAPFDHSALLSFFNSLAELVICPCRLPMMQLNVAALCMLQVVCHSLIAALVCRLTAWTATVERLRNGLKIEGNLTQFILFSLHFVLHIIAIHEIIK